MNSIHSPTIQNAVDKALEIVQQQNITEDGSHALVKPIVLACQTNSSSVITVSLSALSRLITLRMPVVSTVIAIIRQVLSDGLEIQLKILQILLSLFNTTPDLHADEISECLLITFKLQQSKRSVVSSTASATLMQLVLNVFERVSDEDKLDKAVLDSRPSLFVDLEDGTSVPVAPNAYAAHLLYADAITLLSEEKHPLHFIKVGELSRESALELVDSCLKNHVQLFKNHPSLLHLTKHQLYPIIRKMLNDKHIRFSIGTRLMQVTQIILGGFVEEMTAECNELWDTLTQILETTDHLSWMKCCTLELIQSLFSDGENVINVFQLFGKDSYNKLLTAIARFIGEKANVMGHNNDMAGLGTRYIPKETATVDASSYSYVGEVAAMMGNNTSSANTKQLPQRQYRLTASNKLSRLRMMDQRDKQDAPAISDTASLYIALLIILDVCNVYKSIQNNDELTKDMISESWPATIATLSQYLNGEIDDEIFVKCVKSVENMAVVSGTLELNVARDAFLGLLYGFSCPTMAITAIIRWNDRRTDGSMSPSAEHIPNSTSNAPATAYSYPPPRLSNRNHICLGVLINLTAVLSNRLGASWFEVLETLQNAHYVLHSHLDYERKQKQFIPSSEQGTTAAITDNIGVNIAQNSSDAKLLYDNIEEIFKHSVDFSKESLEEFVSALCRLSVGESVGGSANTTSPSSSTRASIEVTRKSSGTYPRHNQSAFAISKLDVVAQLNMRRLIVGEAKAWYMMLDNLMVVVGGEMVEPDSRLRVEASEVLNRLLVSGLSAAQGEEGGREASEQSDAHTNTDKAAIQRSVLNTLKHLSTLNIHGGGYAVSNIVKTIRESGLDTLHKCLENAGVSLQIEWQSVFDILVTSTESKAATQIKKAFEVVNLICNDFLDELSVIEVEKCINVLGQFARTDV
ncbi:hypothetical protein E3P99_03361 [Wallemia hederae]|uniref:Mon2/Sec7/BIG1-like HUS domain-containing protein n=1 Tax=Wallemia hederae TaxID=1540922 RepID=A0A4T0FGH6_9BASI|nr:hypothetical protein E3P99_03361 [Wallemia hederae]